MEKSPLFELADTIENLIVRAQTNIDQHIETTEAEVLVFTEESKKKVTQLKEQKDRLLSEIESASNRTSELKKKLDAIHSRTLSSQEAHERRHTLESMELHNQQLRSERDQLQLELQKKRKEQEAKEMLDAKFIQETMTQLQASINLMQLELINTKDNGTVIKVVMKHVNPHDPEQAFTLVHDLDEEQRYRLVQSNPILPQAYIKPILNELNDTRDYYAFLKNVRKVYQDTLK